MNAVLLALVALAGTAALPPSSALPFDCQMPDVDCYVTCVMEQTIAVPPHVCLMHPGTPIAVERCPPGTHVVAIHVYGEDTMPCWN